MSAALAARVIVVVMVRKRACHVPLLMDGSLRPGGVPDGAGAAPCQPDALEARRRVCAQDDTGVAAVRSVRGDLVMRRCERKAKRVCIVWLR